MKIFKDLLTVEMSRLLAEEGAFGDEIQLLGTVTITKEQFRPSIFFNYSDYAIALMQTLQKGGYLPVPVVHTWRSKGKVSLDDCMKEMLLQITENYSDEYCCAIQRSLHQIKMPGGVIMNSVFPTEDNALYRSVFGYRSYQIISDREKWIINGNYGACVRQWIEDISNGNLVGPISGKQDYSIQMQAVTCQQDYLKQLESENRDIKQGQMDSCFRLDEKWLEAVLYKDRFFCGLFCKKAGEDFE